MQRQFFYDGISFHFPLLEVYKPVGKVERVVLVERSIVSKLCTEHLVHWDTGTTRRLSFGNHERHAGR